MATKKLKDGFEVYEGGGTDQRWYWRLRRKGRIVADGAEAYSRRHDAWRAVVRVRAWAWSLRIPISVYEPPLYRRGGRKR
jgi:uncharacterized protein YegP (UPF0339 family)